MLSYEFIKKYEYRENDLLLRIDYITVLLYRFLL